MACSKEIETRDCSKNALWSFDDVTDEEEEEVYMDANTLNKSMMFYEYDDNRPDIPVSIHQTEVSTLQQLTIDTLKEMDPLENKFKDINLTSPTTVLSCQQSAKKEKDFVSSLSSVVAQTSPLQNSLDETSGKLLNNDDIKLDETNKSATTTTATTSFNTITTLLNDINSRVALNLQQNTTAESQDIVETVIDLMKKRDGVLTFGTVEIVYSFRSIQCLFKISSVEDDGTIGVYRLCRFEQAIAFEDINKATIIDSHRRKLLLTCPKDTIDEQEYYQFCFKNKLQHVIAVSLPFKIILDEFGSRSVFGEAQLDQLGCVSQDDDAILNAVTNSNQYQEEDDEGEFVVVQSKKILLEEKVRELNAHISVVEHDRASKREFIDTLKLEIDHLKEKVSRLELVHRNCESKSKVLTKALEVSEQKLSISEKEVISLRINLDEEKSVLKQLQQETNAGRAARDAYLNSLRCQIKSLEVLVASLNDKYHKEKSANDQREGDMRKTIEYTQKLHTDLSGQWSELNLKHKQLMVEKKQLEEILSQKCKVFAEQEEQSSVNVRQLKARLSQAAEEYEELFRKNYRLEKKYNQLQSKMMSMSTNTVDDNDSTTNSRSTNQSRSILAEVTSEISKHSEISDVTDNLISRIKFQQQKPVPIPRSSYTFDVPNISSMINALLVSPFSEKCFQCKKETTNGTLCLGCQPKEM